MKMTIGLLGLLLISQFANAERVCFAGEMAWERGQPLSEMSVSWVPEANAVVVFGTRGSNGLKYNFYGSVLRSKRNGGFTYCSGVEADGDNYQGCVTLYPDRVNRTMTVVPSGDEGVLLQRCPDGASHSDGEGCSAQLETVLLSSESEFVYNLNLVKCDQNR